MARLMISALIAMVFVCVPVKLSHGKSDNFALTTKVANGLNARLPLMANRWTELSYTVPGHNSLEYVYRLIGLDAPDFQKMKQRSINVVCNEKMLMLLMKRGITLKYSYHDESMKPIGRYSITLIDC